MGPLLFIIILEALSQEFGTGCQWKLLYVENRVIISDRMDELLYKFGRKMQLEAKWFKMNIAKNRTVVKTFAPLGILENTLAMHVDEVLEVIQSFALGLNFRYKRNVVTSKESWSCIKCKRCVKLLSSSPISLITHGMLKNSCARRILLHWSECWAMQREDKKHLLRSEQTILR